MIGELWRILTAPLFHQSFLHLLMNMTTLWSCRVIEKELGTWFFFRYSILLVVSESMLSFTIIYFTKKIILSRRSERDLTGVIHMLESLNSIGSTGLLTAWLAFLSIYSVNIDGGMRLMVLFSFLPMNPILAPIVLIVMYFIFFHRNNLIAIWSSLICGYLLAMGVMQVLSNLYWSLCFVLDISLAVSLSVISHRIQWGPALLPVTSDRYSDSHNITGEPIEFITVLSIGLPSTDESLHTSTSSVRRVGDRSEEGRELEDEDEAAPLLGRAAGES